MKTMVKIISVVVGLVVVLGLTGWIGTKIKPGRFATPAQKGRDLGTAPVPAGLPEPAARYVQVAYGDQIPMVETAMLIGRAEMTINGLTLPARFKFYFRTGEAYYHYFEITWFGMPVLKANERYLDGELIMDLGPLGRFENDAKLNAAAKQGLWAEMNWVPSAWFLEGGATWEAVDEHTARLILPGAAAEEHLTVTFDPATGLLHQITTRRYRDVKDTERRRWTNTITEWGEINGVKVPMVVETQWDDEQPWAVWRVDEVLYNVDVSERLATFGSAYEQ